MEKKRVVITGYGLITPLGRDAQETFNNAVEGKSGIDYIKSFDTRGLPSTIGGEVKNEWLDDLLSERSTKYSSRGCLLFLKALKDAYELARLDDITDRYQIGVSVGSHGDNPNVRDMAFLHRFYDGKGDWDFDGLTKAGGYSFLNFMKRKPDIVSSIIAHKFNCKGTNIVTVSACAAGAQAIGEGYKAILDSRCKVMITGGSESVTDFFGYLGFISLKALAEKYTNPQSASRPFDRKRSGFVMSEGAGVVILEDYDSAIQRNAPIFGEILGYGSSADAYRITDMHPQGLGAVIAMKKAIADAGLSIDDIEYINAHGTSTMQNDMTET
ncbi:MAG: beta-ketoacyl-[acyl-carrier-protein] synthase family protein, partial [Thermodesulfovibrionales bacterium]|nr:beta-ketoacyl-[acyl-carrier-protein] synthase family protein [Thermodesulfovibrionales bacterium]